MFVMFCKILNDSFHGFFLKIPNLTFWLDQFILQLPIKQQI